MAKAIGAQLRPFVISGPLISILAIKRRIAGIYRITVERPDGSAKFYIGQAKCLRERGLDHFRRLIQNAHCSKTLQRAFAKYGVGAFAFDVLEFCDSHKSALTAREQFHLDCYVAAYGRDAVYNHYIECVNAPVGIKLSPESIAKRTAKQKGIKRNPATRALMSLVMTGRTMSAEVRAKVSQSKKGQCPSPEHMENLRLLATGRAMPQQTRDALRLARTGKKRPPEVHVQAWATRREKQKKKMTVNQFDLLL